MARLIVEAVSREIKSHDEAYQLELFVSVSRADDGVSVRGLKQENFRVCVYAGIFAEFEISPSPFSESPWEPLDREPSGCYGLTIKLKFPFLGTDLQKWNRYEYYVFGIQALIRDQAGSIVHQGQTVVRVQSLGV
ncbi:MAG: hypothetical protein H7Y09_07365 [Chitinophagaceae bacterium]|nr:hypothetical protein [Anaerolineae bacterium]